MTKGHYETFINTKEFVETKPGEFEETGRTAKTRAALTRHTGKAAELLDEAMFSHKSGDKKIRRRISAWRADGKVYMEIVTSGNYTYAKDTLIDFDNVFPKRDTEKKADVA